MDRRLAERLQDAPGFGNCQRCPYQASGPAELCYTCARHNMEELAALETRCGVCDRPFAPDESECRNPLCTSPERQFQWNFAIAMRSGVLERALTRYKYEGKMGWALIFGRILAGFLDQEASTFEAFDLIIASPTYAGQGGRTFDHTGLVLQHAAAELGPGRTWPFDSFDSPVLVKAAPTESVVGKGFAQRREIALGLRHALRVTAIERTQNRSILVYDDVFTTGGTLNEIAWVLRKQGGARLVCGVTLCRQPWRGLN